MVVLLPVYPCPKVDIRYPFYQQMVLPAMSIALESVQNTYLPGENITLIIKDTECELSSAQFAMIDLMFTHSVDVVMGPVLEYVVSAVGRLLGRWEIPHITAGGLAAGFLEHGKRHHAYPTLTRVQGTYRKGAEFVSHYFSSMGWNHSMIIFFDSERVVNDCMFGVGPIFNLNTKAGLTGTDYTQIDGEEEDYNLHDFKDILDNKIRPVARGKTNSFFSVSFKDHIKYDSFFIAVVGFQIFWRSKFGVNSKPNGRLYIDIQYSL